MKIKPKVILETIQFNEGEFYDVRKVLIPIPACKP